MEGVTDFATRLWIVQNGAPDFTTTPFLRVTKDYPPKRISANFLPESQLSKEHGIVSCLPQLMASEEDDLIRIARHFLEQVPFIDINCGCPSPTVVGHGAGSSLLQEPRRFSDYLKKITDALGPQKVSVKMRIGFHHESEFARLLDSLVDIPLSRLTVHGRTRSDRYKGLARWSFIGEAARRLPYPVYGSGDVTDSLSLRERIIDAPGISGVIIGRGALRDPWIFARLRNTDHRTSREEFRLRIIQFVLLQELQSAHCDAFLAAVRDGLFSQRLSAQPELRCKQIHEQTVNLLKCVPTSLGQLGLEPVNWTISRASVARGKMLWNYLRSGIGVAPELTTRLLRAPTWSDFLFALESVVSTLGIDDVGLTHRPEWDWVYAGAGQTDASRERHLGSQN